MFVRISCWVTVFAISLYGLKQYSNGGVCMNNNQIDGKVVLVTGGTSGLGLETATVLAQRGGKIYITCRSRQKGLEAAAHIKNITGRTVTPLQLELSSVKSIRNFAKTFQSMETKLDILINNAGVFYLDGKTEDGFEIAFGVNHLGHFLLTHLLMDEIMATEEGRIIVLSSDYYVNGYINWDDINNNQSKMDFVTLYGQSKMANILFANELAKRLTGTSVSVYSLHPGGILTNILRNFFYEDTPLVWWLSYIAVWPFTKDVHAGVQTTICCATDKNLVSGKYYTDCLEKELNAAARSEADAKRLWDLSIKILSMKPNDIHPIFS